MKDTEKKALLNKMFNLEIIKDINREVNKEHLALTKINKEYDNINKDNNIETIVTAIEKFNKDKKELNEKYVKKVEEREKVKKDITVEEYKLNELNKQVEEIDNIEELLSQQEKVNKDNEKNKKVLLEYHDSIKELETKYENNKNTFEQMGDVEEKYKIWKKEKKEKINQLNKEYQELTEQKKPIRELTKQEKKEKKQKKQKEELIEELEKDKNNKKEYYEEYDNYDLIDEYNNKLKEKEEIITQQEDLDKQLLNFIKNLKKIEEHKFNKNCDACMSNSITKQKLYYEEEISKLNDTVKENNDIINDLDNFISKKKKKYEKLITSKELSNEINILNENIIQNKKEIKELIKIEKEYNKNKDYNNEINHKIEINREHFNHLYNEQNNDYINYKDLKEQINDQNIEIVEIRERISILETKIEKNINKLNGINNIIQKYNTNKKIYEELEQNKISWENNKEKEKTIEDSCKELVNKINTINKELNKLDASVQIIQKNKELITKNNKKKEVLGIIKGATDSGGILDDILKTNIIPAIENIVNDILMNIDTYKIKIAYDNNIKITKIENNTEMESSGLMASGHEKSVLNIIFRLALSKLNSIISTNFFIIDEAFKNSDANKKQKLKTLFEYLRNNYDWVLIVTHDDYIKDNFDKEINIEHNKGTSALKYN
jgi:exonuclease SbcC